MKRLIFLLFICSSVLAADKVLEIKTFKGIDNVSGDFEVQDGFFRRMNNIDPHRRSGDKIGAGKRLGYDSVSTFSQPCDSIIDISPAYWSDGSTQLFITSADTGIGLASIYISNKNSSALDSTNKIWTWWSDFGRPTMRVLNDQAYIVNGYNRGIVYSNGITRDYPPRSPAEPVIVPLSDAGGLNGTYRYVLYAGDSSQVGFDVDTTIDTTRYECILYKGSECLEWIESVDGDSVAYDTTIDTAVTVPSSFQSVIASPVRVKNGQIYLTRFSFPNADSTHPNYADSGGARIVICRTKGDFLRLTETTPIYYVTDFLVPTSDSANSYVFIDSLSDSDISTIYQKFDFALDLEKRGKDSTGVIQTYYGAPGFMSVDDTLSYSDSTDTSSAYGIYHGIVEQRDTLGFAYFVTLIDTVINIESDTSRGCYVFNDTSVFDTLAKPYKQTISLPKLINSDSGVVYNLYRAQIEQITYDSSYWERLPHSEYFRYIGQEGDSIIFRNFNVYKWVYNIIPDTVIIRDLYLLAQLSATDTSYTDSLRQDSVSTKRRFEKTTPNALLDNIFSANNRLHGIDGSALRYTDPLGQIFDSLQNWGGMRAQYFNKDDGDICVAGFEARGLIRVFKNGSNYNSYNNYLQSEKVGDWGIIAPKSVAHGFGGTYYLSNRGWVYETEGSDIERKPDYGLIDEQINNFDNFSTSQLKQTYSVYFDRRLMVTVPDAGDSLYLYDELTGGWYTWAGISFGSAFRYGCGNGVDFNYPDTLYFFKPGGKTLYRYGTSEYDNTGADSTDIQIVLRTAPLLYNPFYKPYITKVGLWTNSASTNDTLYLNIKDISLATTLKQLRFDTLSSRHSIVEAGAYDPAEFYQLDLGSGLTNKLSNTIIDKIDIFYNYGEESEVE